MQRKIKKIAKQIYKFLPFKRNIFLLIKYIFGTSLPENLSQHLHFNGTIKVFIDSSRKEFIKIKHRGDLLENQLFWLGIDRFYEQHSLRVWRKLAKESEVIFDLGANTGIYSLVSKAVNQKAEIYSFEPVPETYNWLKENIDLNNFSIYSEQIALSNYNGMSVIKIKEEDHYAATLSNELDDDINVKSIPIETRRIDDYVAVKGIKGVDLLKMDVELHEPEVLEGMTKTLSMFRPSILLEVHRDDIGVKIQEKLDGLNYLYFDIDEKERKLKKVDEIRHGSYLNFLIIQPEVAKRINLF